MIKWSMTIVEGMTGQFSFGKAEKHVLHVIRASMHACISPCQRRIALLFINHVHYYASSASTLFSVDRRLDHGLLWVKSRRWSSPLYYHAQEIFAPPSEYATVETKWICSIQIPVELSLGSSYLFRAFLAGPLFLDHEITQSLTESLYICTCQGLLIHNFSLTKSIKLYCSNCSDYIAQNLLGIGTRVTNS